MFEDLTKAPVPGQKVYESSMTIGKGSSMELAADKSKRSDKMQLPDELKDKRLMVLHDTDMSIFACASITDGKYYEIDGQTFRYMKGALKVATDTGFTRADIETKFKPDTFSNASHILDTNHKTTESVLPDDTFTVYVVSGPNNFRKEIYPAYKSSRKNKRTPHHRKQLTEYMVSIGASSMDTLEADDLLGILQVQTMSSSEEDDIVPVICSEDKDLKCIPGWHMNPKKCTLEFISEFDAWKRFCIQTLMGDTTDDIPALKGVGIKTAEKLLAKCSTELECWEKVKEAYKNKKWAYIKVITKDGWITTQFEGSWEEYLHMNAQLVWIKHTYEGGYDDKLRTFS